MSPTSPNFSKRGSKSWVIKSEWETLWKCGDFLKQMPITNLNDNRVGKVSNPQRGHSIHIRGWPPESHLQCTCSESEILHFLSMWQTKGYWRIRGRALSKLEQQQPWKRKLLGHPGSDCLNYSDSPGCFNLRWAWKTFQSEQNWYNFEGHASFWNRVVTEEQSSHPRLELRVKFRRKH